MDDQAISQRQYDVNMAIMNKSMNTFQNMMEAVISPYQYIIKDLQTQNDYKTKLIEKLMEDLRLSYKRCCSNCHDER